MFALRIIVCSMLLGCSLSIGLGPDTGLRSRMNTVPLWEQKRRALMKSLEEYSPKPPLTTTAPKNTSPASTFLSTILSSSHTPEKQLPFAFDKRPDDSMVPGSENIHSLDDYYRVMYGTPEGISFLRKNFGPNGLQRARSMYTGIEKDVRDLREANSHYLKIWSEGKCRVPRKQVVCVKDYYPDPSKAYLPHCTLLHRCGDQTGCCDSAAFRCVPTAMQEVAIAFFVIQTDRFGESRHENRIEKLLFDNHTACGCQPINDLPRLLDSPQDPLDGEQISSSSKPKCRECPVPFTSRIYNDSRCGCDCFDKQRPCLRIKRGREPLREIERRCVETNHCYIPSCEFGEYDSSTGFCPKKQDHKDQKPHTRRPNHLHPSHRWMYLERD